MAQFLDQKEAVTILTRLANLIEIDRRAEERYHRLMDQVDAVVEKRDRLRDEINRLSRFIE